MGVRIPPRVLKINVMKIDIDKIKQIPKEISEEFGLCVYGKISDEIKAWMEFHGMQPHNMGNYTNIYTDKNIIDLFNHPKKFKYLDGFSPNLNKHLHIGHFSNLVLAKAFKSMGVAEKSVAILGDTIDGEVNKDEALNMYEKYCTDFNYPLDYTFMASMMVLEGSELEDGEEIYAGTKVFNIEGKKVVGIKSDESTSYFYQDVAFAQMLQGNALYLTGSEQVQHFDDLKKLFPNIHHIGLGLVKTKSGKMSSRLGNVIWMEDILSMLMNNFNNDKNLCYNVFAGFILKSSPKSDKNIDMDQLENPLNSPGLYLSYTLAKLKSAGVKCKKGETFISQDLQFKYMKAFNSLSPNILFEGLIDHAKKISGLYITHKIKDNAVNQSMFEILSSDLLLGMSLLGLLDVDKV